MSFNDRYTLGFAFGYTLTAIAFCFAAYCIFAIFNIGYIGAELMAAYMTWTTIYQWDSIVISFNEMLEAASK